MNRYARGLLAALCLCVLGCEFDVYEIKLRPRDHTIARTVTVFHGGYDADESGDLKPRVKSPLPQKALDKLVTIYGQPTAGPDDVSVFDGEFGSEMPDDVGGFGSYTFLPSNMGSATLYTERFGGDIDIAANIESGFEAADLVTDILIGWLGGQFESRSEWPELREFLDTQLRDDLKNFSAYFWTITNQPSHYQLKADSGLSSPIIENFMRLGSYMVERGYIAPAEVKVLFETISRKPSPKLDPLIADILGEKVGLEDKAFIDEVAGAISSMNQPTNSLEKFLSESGFGEKLKANTAGLIAPSDNPTNVDYMAKYTGYFLLHTGGQAGEGKLVRVSLACPLRPEMTNGRWDDKTSKVHWPPVALPFKLGNWPVFIYATWSVPDDDFQKIRFGKVVLKDNRLVDYCLWRDGLPAKQVKRFDDFLASLAPGETLIERLEAFHFEDEPATAQAEIPGKKSPKPYELSSAKDQIQAILAVLYDKAKPTPLIKPAAPPVK